MDSVGCNIGCNILSARFYLDKWAAFSSGQRYPGQSEFGVVLDNETAKDVSFLPALSRRRLSGLSKLTLRLAHECMPDYQGYCVFGSQHGELQTTQKLLESIVNDELMSPAGFSSSVHNTAVGLHSINNRNIFPCTSIAAGLDTLTMCFIEAYSLLENNITDQVLVVFADDTIPDDLARFSEYKNERHGFAALIKNNGTGYPIQIEPRDKPNSHESDQLLALVDALQGTNDSTALLMQGETVDWQWVIYA